MLHVLKSFAERQLKDYFDAHPNAKEQGKGECCRSGRCCFTRPGALNQADVAALAAHFGLTPQELFRQYLVVDDILGIRVVVPRRKTQDGGRMLGWRDTYDYSSACNFLGEDLACQIHEVKPIACREYKCWDFSGKANLPPWNDAELIALGWDGVNPDDAD